MSNSILPAAGNLDIVNANVRADKFNAATNIGVSNSAPTKNFSVGTKFHVDKDSVDPVSVTGNVVASGIKISNLTISPAFDFASVSNVGNVTANVIQFANATTGFTTTANVEIGGNITLTSNAQVKVGSNVLAEYTGPHGREPKEMPLKKFPEIVFDASKFDKNDTTNTYTQGGYTISANTQYNDGEYAPWDMYVPGPGPLTGTHYWSSDSTQLYNAYWGGTLVGSPSAHYQTVVSSVTYNGVFTTIQLPHKIKLNSIDIQSHKSVYFPHSGIIAGSTDGSTWHLIHSFSDLSTPDTPVIENIITNSAGNTNHYNYLRLIITKGGGNAYIGIRHLRWNGYEEPAPPGDLSLDTTLKSTFNSVRSNNYVMYFDGDGFIPGDNTSNNLVTGSNKSVIHHNATYDSTGKYWTLDGSTESNVTTGSLGLVGDTPHTVSTWINASNLDANATTQQLFSIGSGYSEEIVRVDDTQIAANTWHNVTYAYQGEGGSKVTYVDGRKVEEAQVEDTFGDYPPFAMTGYKTGGYVVSSNFENSTEDRKSYNAFNAVGTGNRWQVDSGYSTSGDFLAVAVNGPLPSITDTNGTAHVGHWLKLELPHKLRLNRFKTTNYIHSQYQLKSYVILGSNDDVNWTLLHSEADANLAGGESGGTHDTGISGVTESFKYLKLLVKAKANGSSATLMVQQVIFYGHKEGDLTRFPEPTRVLKYPHILTKNGTGDGFTSATSAPEYGKRGYVIKASSSIGSYPPYAAFNGETHVATGTTWIGGYNSYGTNNSGVSVAGGYKTTGAMNLKTNLGTGGSATSNGEWLYIEMPHKIKVTSTKIISNDGVGYPPDYLIIYGTNDPSSSGGWNVVDNTYDNSSSGIVNNATGKTWAVSTASSPVAYKYFALVIVKVNSSATFSHALVTDWQLLGTQEDTGTPAIVGGPFAGKVANFRVYDQYLGDERIQEIYDAQKDEFGHKKSSMTLYKGRVGVGTTEPEGALTVLDEPHALERFPSSNLSADYSFIEGEGCIKISSSGSSGSSGGGGYGGGGGSSGAGFSAFDGLTSTRWSSTPTRNTRVSEEVDFGAWLKIQTPESMSLKKAEIESNPDWRQVGGDILGSTASTQFGKSVDCNHDGTRIISSAYQTSSSPVGEVRVYDWDGSAWTQVGNTLAGPQSSPTQGYFGETSVSISGDGTIIAVGSRLEDPDLDTDKGTVRVFYLNGAVWTVLPDSGSETTNITTGTSALRNDIFVGVANSDNLGFQTKLSYDGKTILMTAPNFDDSSAGTDTGQARIYTYSNGAWSKKGDFLIGSANEHLGYSADMSEDGNCIVLGGYAGNNDNAWIYIWDGSSWVNRGASGTNPAFTRTDSDQFGKSCAISNDGTVIAFGVFEADIADGALADNTGIVQVYHWSGSAWVLKGTLVNKDNTDDTFGSAVSLSGDGKRLIVGAQDDSTTSANNGRLYTFEYNGSTWVRREPFASIGISSGVGDDTEIGRVRTTVISRDGSVILSGERGFNSGNGTDSGRVRVFSMPSNIKSIWGSNDDVNWTKITTAPTREEATSNVAGLAFGYDDRLEFKNLDNPNYYKYHAIVADAFTQLKEVKLFGVRNQGSSTLHDGTLTLTKKVTAPQLESTGIINMKGDYTEIRANSNVVTCFDRSKKLIKYPRVALTSAQSAPVTENGYTVTVSNETTNKGIGAFDGATGASSATLWYSGTLSHYSTSDGSAVTSGTNIAPRLDTNTDYGEWISIGLPVAIKLTSFHLWQQYNDVNHFPQSATIYARNETNDPWVEIYRYDGRTRTQRPDIPEIFDDVNSYDFYKHFAFVGRRRVQGINATTGISLGEWKLFGVPEYDPEADGVDVVVKSVPNVPNTDWLEVYYDGQDYSTMPTTVTDKSGNNHTGTPNGGVGFDTEYKAFTFDGSNDGISTTSTATLSNHTASMWIKFEQFSGWAAAYAIRPASLDRNNAFLYANSDGRFRLEALGNTGPYKDYTYNFQFGKWVHLTVLFEHTGLRESKIYVDNVELVPTGTVRSDTDNITITGNTTVYIASEPTYYLYGSVANFRLFNQVLTQDEIYQLYAYQKEYFGHGDLSMTLKAGRLGIGTSEPQAALDVRGTFQGNSPLRFYVLSGFHPSSATTLNVPFDEHLKRGGQIVSFTGSTTTSTNSIVPWNYHNESNQYEIMVYWNAQQQYFTFFGQGTSTFGLPWKMFVVTT